MKRHATISVLSVALALCSATSAYAASAPEKLGTFGFWRSYMVTEDSQPVCYMTLTAKPPALPAPAPTGKKKKNAPKTIHRGDVTIMITQRPSEGSHDVVSYASGIRFKSPSEAKATINGKSFNLFTQNDTAWSRDAATDHALTQAIRGASVLNFTGESAIGPVINDTVNLKGADAAYVSMSKACGMSVSPLTKPAKPAAKAPIAKPKKPASPTAPHRTAH